MRLSSFDRSRDPMCQPQVTMYDDISASYDDDVFLQTSIMTYLYKLQWYILANYDSDVFLRTTMMYFNRIKNNMK